MQRSLKQRLLAGGAWAFTGKLATAGSGVAVDALLTRLLGAGAFGVYGLAFSVVTVAAMAAQLGLHQAVVRFVAEAMGTGRRARARGAVLFAFRFCLVGVAGVAALLLLFGDRFLARGVWDAPLLGAAMGGIAAWMAVRALEVLTSESFRGFQDLRYATLFGGSISGVLSMIVLLVVWLTRGEATLGFAVATITGATAVSLVLGLGVLFRRIVPAGPAESLAASEVAPVAGPLWLNGVTAFALMRLDLWILGAYLPKEQLGIYFAAARLVALVGVSLILVNLVVPPYIAQMYAAGEKKRLERILRNTATLAGLPAFAVLAAFVLFGGPILGLVYTEEYRAGATVLALLAVGKLVNVWTGSCGVTLSMTGHQVTLMRITMITGAITVTASLAVVKSFGMLGVASVVSIGAMVQNLSMWIATRRFTGMWTHASIPDRRALRGLFGSGA